MGITKNLETLNSAVMATTSSFRGSAGGAFRNVMLRLDADMKVISNELMRLGQGIHQASGDYSKGDAQGQEHLQQVIAALAPQK